MDTATPLTMILSETTGAETIMYWHALDTLAQSDGTSVEYFAYDGLGSVRQLVDTSGSVGLAQTFDPYGNGYATSGSASSRLGWTGEQVDGNGFVYLRARYYNPAIGRFFQLDPSRLEKNPYLYGMSNPVLHTDPSGLLACSGSETCNPVTPSSSSSSGDPITIKIDVDPAFLIYLITGSCAVNAIKVHDFIIGALTQYYWDMAQPQFTIMSIVPVFDVLSTILRMHNERILDQAYWTGTQAYRDGRDFGRALSTTIGIIETGVGAAAALATVKAITATAFGAAISCPAAPTGVGAVACAVTVTGVAVEVGVFAAGATLAVHGGLVLAYINNNPVGGQQGSGQLKTTTLDDLRNNTPDQIPGGEDWRPPKNWNGNKVKNPNGAGSGWPAKNGDVWVPTDHKGTHGPHWDVQHRNGTHTPVYPDP